MIKLKHGHIIFLIILFNIILKNVFAQGIINEQRNFQIYKDSNYILKSKISPQLYKAFSKKYIPINLKDFSFSSNSSNSNYINREYFSLIRTYINRSDSTNSDIAYSMLNLGYNKLNKNFNVEEYPEFSINYQLQNPDLMDLTVQMGFDLDDDRSVDMLSYSAGSDFLMKNVGLSVDFSKSKTTEKDNYYLIKRELGIGMEDSTWRYEAMNSEIAVNKGESQLDAQLYFDGNAAEDEFGIIQRRINSIDLEQYPFISLEYELQDKNIQQIQILSRLDFNENGRPDGVIASNLSDPNSNELTFNAYELAARTFPNKKNYKLVEVIIHLKKINDVDVSKKQGEYSFILKNMTFYKEVPFLESNYLPEESINNNVNYLPIPANVKSEDGINTLSFNIYDNLKKNFPEAENFDLSFLNLVHYKKKTPFRENEGGFSYCYISNPQFINREEKEVPAIYVLDNEQINDKARIFSFKKDFKKRRKDLISLLENLDEIKEAPNDSFLLNINNLGVPENYVFVSTEGQIGSLDNIDFNKKRLLYINKETVNSLFEKQHLKITETNITSGIVLSNEELIFNLDFDVSSNKNERVILSKDFSPIDLSVYPLFNMMYQIENQYVQQVELHFLVSFDENASKTVNIPITALSQENNYTNLHIDLFSLLKKQFPDNKNYYLNGLQIHLAKRPGLDMNRRLNKDDQNYGDIYEYRLKNIYLSKDLNRYFDITEIFKKENDFSHLNGKNKYSEASGFYATKKNVLYSLQQNEYGLEIEAFFQKEINENPELKLSLETNINLNNSPFFMMDFSLEDSLFQRISAQLSVIGKNKKTYPISIPLISKLEYNIKELLNDSPEFEKADPSELYLKRIDFDLNISGGFLYEDIQKSYIYIIESIEMYNYSEGISDYLKNTVISGDVLSIVHNFENSNTRYYTENPDFVDVYYPDGSLKGDNILLRGMEDSHIVLTTVFDRAKKIDLRKYPIAEVNYTVSDNIHQKIDFSFYVSPDGQDRKAREIQITPVDLERYSNQLELLSRAHEMFPDANELFLDSLRITVASRNKLQKTGFSAYEFAVSPIKFLSPFESTTTIFNEVIQKPVIKLDDKDYLLTEKQVFDIFDENGTWCTMDTVFLEKGTHELGVFSNNFITVDMIELKSIQEDSLESIDVFLEEPEIVFNKINPTRYIVQVKASNPFWLVFSESFHPKWKAYVLKSSPEEYKDIRNKWEWSALITSIQDKNLRYTLSNHEMVNGYANGWYVPVDSLVTKGIIDKDKFTNNSEFTVVLEFTPQRLFEIGVIISLITLGVLLLLLAFMFFKKLVVKFSKH